MSALEISNVLSTPNEAANAFRCSGGPAGTAPGGVDSREIVFSSNTCFHQPHRGHSQARASYFHCSTAIPAASATSWEIFRLVSQLFVLRGCMGVEYNWPALASPPIGSEQNTHRFPVAKRRNNPLRLNVSVVSGRKSTYLSSAGLSFGDIMPSRPWVNSVFPL